MARWDAENERWVQDPPVGPKAPGAPYGGDSGRRALIVAAAVVLVCGAAGAGLWALTDHGDSGGPGLGGWPSGAGTSSTSEYSTGPSPTYDPGTTGDSAGDSDTTLSPSAEPPTTDAPPGFVHVQDPAGFALDVPDSWERTSGGASVYYETADGSDLIQIFALNGPETTPYDSLAATEQTVSNDAQYQRIGLGYVIDDPASDAAELEYTYLRDDGSTRHVVDRAFTGPDGVQYALLVAGPDTDWSTSQQIFQVARDSFCPVGYCGG